METRTHALLNPLLQRSESPTNTLHIVETHYFTSIEEKMEPLFNNLQAKGFKLTSQQSHNLRNILSNKLSKFTVSEIAILLDKLNQEIDQFSRIINNSNDSDILIFKKTSLNKIINNKMLSKNVVFGFIRDLIWATLAYCKTDIFSYDKDARPNNQIATQTALATIGIILMAIVYESIYSYKNKFDNMALVESLIIIVISATDVTLHGYLQEFGLKHGTEKLNLPSSKAEYLSAILPGIIEMPIQSVRYHLQLLIGKDGPKIWANFVRNPTKYLRNMLFVFGVVVPVNAIIINIWQEFLKDMLDEVDARQKAIIFGLVVAVSGVLCSTSLGVLLEFKNNQHLIVSFNNPQKDEVSLPCTPPIAEQEDNSSGSLFIPS